LLKSVIVRKIAVMEKICIQKYTACVKEDVNAIFNNDTWTHCTKHYYPNEFVIYFFSETDEIVLWIPKTLQDPHQHFRNERRHMFIRTFSTPVGRTANKACYSIRIFADMMNNDFVIRTIYPTCEHLYFKVSNCTPFLMSTNL